MKKVDAKTLAKVGIKVDIQSFDWGTFYGDIKSGRFQMYSLSWVGIKTPDIFRYNFSQVVALDLAYLVTFGSELALVSMLPLFYKDTFDTSVVLAGILAAIYPVMNLVARPAGGLISDRIGRKKTLVILFFGISVSFLIKASISKISSSEKESKVVISV